MKLPVALKPWAQQLKIFPDEISLSLGVMAQKISPFVAPLRCSAEEASNREPNGYDGVARRGIYERLLLSELALADEISEEFVRRAVMGEHLFLNLARVAPSPKRVSIALFNTGAEQLGTPRIGQLAALIVLSRRAASVNANFAWGILPDADMKMFSEVTESNILSLIHARTAHSLKPEYIVKWREKLQQMENVSDVWLIGGKEELKSLEQTKDFSLLTIEDVLEPEQRRLQISVKSASGSEKQIMLELPDEGTCTRLLRNPFDVYKLPEKADLKQKFNSFFFDENGGKIFARGGEKSILYIPIPNSPNAVPGNPRQYSLYYKEDLLLGAGRLGKSVATIALSDAGHLRLYYPKSGNFHLPQGNYLLKNAELILPEDAKTLLPIYNLRFSDSPFFNAAFLDAKSNLFWLKSESGIGEDIAGRVHLLATDVLAAARTENRFMFVGREQAGKSLQIISYGKQNERRDLPLDQVTRAFFGRGFQSADKIFGLLAVGNLENHFAVITSYGEKYIDADPAGSVVGVFQDPSFSPEAGLIELAENRRTLNFNAGKKYSKRIFTADEEIRKIIFSHRSPVCAYQTVSGEIVIFSLTHRAPIANFGG